MSEASVREQDRLLPIANIGRIMKNALPDSAKMSKEAKQCVQECVSEFIGFITSEASERLQEDKRKTITGDDLIDSLRALGFGSYMEFLQAYLDRYREVVRHDKPGGSGRRGKRPTKSGPPGRKKRKRDSDVEETDEDEED